MRERVILLLAAMFLTTGLCLGGAEKQGSADQPRFSESEFIAHLKFLASDICEGRAPGTRGGELATAYIAAQFEAIGLKPISEEQGYFQQVPMLGIETIQDSVKFTLSAGGQSVSFAPVDEVVINSELPLDAVGAEGDLLFVGYGIVAPEYDWDDYKGVDVKDKILVMLVNDPDLEKTGFYNESLSYYGRWTYKEEIARAKGAKGIILIHTDETATYNFSVVQNSWAVERKQIRGTINNQLLINSWVAQPAFDKALAFVGTTYAELKEKADGRDFQPVPLGISVKAEFKQEHREYETPNVIGILPGTTKGDEAVIYCGHWDHFGVGRAIDGDNIYNGARDNASGIAAIICLARAYTEMAPPERSIVFMATTSEEFGLLGAEYHAMNPIFPLEKTAIAVNIDVVNVYGPTEDFGAGIVKFTNALDAVRAIGERLGLTLNIGGADRGGGTFRSDHFPLCARGVVALSTGTGRKVRGMSEEDASKMFGELFAGRYHQPSDEMDPRWRYDGTIQAMNLYYAIGRHWADGAERPELLPDNPYIPAIRMKGLGK